METIALSTGDLRGAAVLGTGILVVGLLLAGVVYALVTRPSTRRAEFRGARPGPRWLGAGLGALIFFIAAMFAHGQYWGRFFAVTVEPDRVVLSYPWPTGEKVVSRAQVLDVRTVTAGRGYQRAVIIDTDQALVGGQQPRREAVSVEDTLVRWWKAQAAR